MFFRKYKEMQGLINASRKALAEAETRIVERNKLIEYQSNDIKEMKSRITDLENNVEILVNNLSLQKKKLIRPGNQN